MREPTVPNLQKWPFLLGDALLLGTAWLIQAQSVHPLAALPMLAIVCCVGFGASLAILPFVLEFQAGGKLTEAATLASTVSELKGLQVLVQEIKTATGLWQSAQDAADKTSASAREIADRMSAEAKSFMEFLEKANSGEKAALRLEVEKFRRAEAEWMQVLVRVLDHVYALYQGALKSGQPNLVEQLGRFQRSCYDAARRIGLAAFVATPAEPFNEERHQPAEGNGKPPGDSIIEETLATGYTFQGKVARRALVRLRSDGKAIQGPGGEGQAEATQSHSGNPSSMPPGQPGGL